MQRLISFSSLSLLLMTSCGGTAKPSFSLPPTLDSAALATPPEVSITPASNAPNVSPADAVGTVSSPFQLTVNQAAMNAILLQSAIMKPFQGENTLAIPDFALDTPFAVSISGISLDVKYAFNEPTLNPATQAWDFTTQQISAEMTVQNITASETVIVTVGGTQMTVHLNGTCSQVHLTLPAGASQASGTIQLNLDGDKPHLKLTSFNPTWTPGTWQVASMNCQGPSGFGDLVAQTVTDRLRQINPYVQLIQQAVETQLDGLVMDPIVVSMDLGPTTSVNLRAKTFTKEAGHPGNNAIVVNGQADFLFKNVAPNLGCGAQIDKFHNSPSQNAAGNELVLPFEAIQALAACAQLDGVLQYHFDSSNVSAFTALEKCWLKDLLVWPDLIRFSGDSIFQFNVRSLGTPTLANPWKAGPHRIALDTWLPLELQILAPVNGQSIPYVRFDTDFTGPATMTVAGGIATVMIDPSSKINIDDTWDPDYVAAYHPDQRIWMTKIDTAAQDFLSKTGLSFTLPSFNIADKLSLAPISADLEELDNVHVAIQIDSR
jgi:hypothetical protein